MDTLNYPYNTIIRIWGSSPTDVWAVSPGGDLDKTIFHYDGVRWTTDGISRPISPSTIWGFASDNIFIGGSNGKIWKYSGNVWQEFAVLTKDGNAQVGIDNIWGESPNDFFASGAYPDDSHLFNNTVIAHFSGNNWAMLNTTGVHGVVVELYKDKGNRKTYLSTAEWNNGISYDSLFIYEYTDYGVTKIYQGTWNYNEAAGLSLISGEVYFLIGRKIAKRIYDKFIIILNVEDTNFDNDIWGRNSKDIFLRMTDGLAHYNGSDIEYLLHFNKSRTQIFGAALFEKEVFFIVYEAQTNLRAPLKTNPLTSG